MLDGPPISWDKAREIYKDYIQLFGNIQSLERIAQRGGFGYVEAEFLREQVENKKH